MPQESIIAGIIRSLRSNVLWALLIIGLSVLCAFCLNKYAPAAYQTEALLRVLTTEANDTDLASNMRGILSQKPIIAEIAQASGVSEDEIKKEDTVSLSNEGGSLVKLVVRHENVRSLNKLGDAVIQALSKHFLKYNSEVQAFEIENRKDKLLQIESSIIKASNELKEAQVKEQKLVSESSLSLENAVQQLEDKIESKSEQLQNMPNKVFYYQEEENKDYKVVCAQLKKERNKLAELFKTYKDKHPRIIACKNRVKDLERKEKKSRTKVCKSRPNPEKQALLNEIELNKADLAELKKQLQAHKNEEKNKPDDGRLAAVKIRLETLKELHKKTLMQLEEYKICKKTLSGRINVLKKDARPPEPVGFSDVQRDIIVVASGFLLAVFLLYTPQPVKAELINVSSQSAPGAVLPLSSSEQALLAAEPAEIILEAPRLSAEPLALPYMLPSGAEADKGKVEPPLAVSNVDSKQLESYKKLAANLQISIAESQTRIILVASARSKAGRTSLLCNISVLMAKAGYSVIMVDADFRSPKLHKVFNYSNSLGLSNALQKEDISSFIHETDIHGLSLLTSGPMPGNAAEALGSQAMIELLANLKRKYELIFVDTPAMLEYPETGVLAGHTGAIVFLSRENEPESELKAAKNLINKVRAKVFGYVKI